MRAVVCHKVSLPGATSQSPEIHWLENLGNPRMLAAALPCERSRLLRRRSNRLPSRWPIRYPMMLSTTPEPPTAANPATAARARQRAHSPAMNTGHHQYLDRLSGPGAATFPAGRMAPVGRPRTPRAREGQPRAREGQPRARGGQPRACPGDPGPCQGTHAYVPLTRRHRHGCCLRVDQRARSARRRLRWPATARRDRRGGRRTAGPADRLVRAAHLLHKP
jgi:hypothetical protein